MAGAGLQTEGGGSHYDRPQRISYSFGEFDFGAGGESLSIPVPAGKDGFIIEEIAVSATETFTATTTDARVEIGTASDTDKFAELALGTLADTNALGFATGTDDAGADPRYDNSYGGPGVVRTGSTEENITQVEVTFVAPTGGTPAGKGYVTIVLAWF